jgi:hypothetical protein
MISAEAVVAVPINAAEPIIAAIAPCNISFFMAFAPVLGVIRHLREENPQSPGNVPRLFCGKGGR